MPKIFFGKFNHEKQGQITERFYAAGVRGDQWYGGIEPGDYVFPVTSTAIIGLWKVREYGEKQNLVNPDNNGVVFFDVVKSYDKPVPLQQFINSSYFDLNINLLNKIIKSTNGCGFFEITPSSFIPNNLEEVDFSHNRQVFIALEGQSIKMNEDDLLIYLNNITEAKMTSFQTKTRDGMNVYEPLTKLYNDKNPINERYSLRKLLEYAVSDIAPKKENYLRSVLKELETRGYFQVVNLIQLYDNIIVGRRKTPRTEIGKKGTTLNPVEILDIDDEFNEVNEYYKFAELLEFNPNLILYGPPGTGKTYATKKIIEAFEAKNAGKVISFDQVDMEKRVKFITFHQSYSYEEFIEGIRPQFDESDEDNGALKYKVEDGILKKLVESASTQQLKAENVISGIELLKVTSKVWKVSLGLRNESSVYNRSKQNKQIAVNWMINQDLSGKDYNELYSLLERNRDKDAPKPTQDANSLDLMLNQMSIGDVVLIYDSPTTIRDIGVVTSDYEYIVGEDYPHTRQVLWLKEFTQPLDISELNNNKRLTLKTIYELSRISMSDIQKMIGNVTVEEKTVPQGNPKPYYLIIDEINRGNISRIFGELITLIEKDKRQTLSVTLPYSNNKTFTLPKNLYIIGTMNTADRSIAMLDTALRRRFVFVEVEPDYEVFANPNLSGSQIINNSVQLDQLLLRLNEIITDKLDRDHRIGHAYFMDIITLDDLYKAWYYKVLPLIAEYFYNDISTVQNVVGKKFFNSDGSMTFLSIFPGDSGRSQFEEALLRIYKESVE